MFALASPPFQHAFYPSSPSPLSPLHPNACQFGAHAGMPQRKAPNPTLTRKPGFFTSTRVQQRPSLSRRDPQKERERRRVEFLSKVKERGNEKRFEARNEQLQRMDAIAELKAWEKEQERNAAQWAELLEQEDELDVGDQMVEEYVSQENWELEAVMSSMEEQPLSVPGQTDSRETGGYGSEEEDYDALMMEALQQIDGGRECATESAHVQHDGDMDVSMG